MAELNIAERRLPQDGRIRVTGRAAGGRHPRLHRAHGPRRVDRDAAPRPLVACSCRSSKLGLRRDDRGRRFDALIRRPHGILLVTGPTGSGKTTTLYAALDKINSPGQEDHHHRGPGRVPAQGRQPDPGAGPRSASPSPPGCATSCARTPTSSWSARSATWRRPRSPSRRRSPATWSSPRCTPTTRPAPSPGCSTWASSRTWSPPCSTACSPSGWCAASARPAARRDSRTRPISSRIGVDRRAGRRALPRQGLRRVPRAPATGAASASTSSSSSPRRSRSLILRRRRPARSAATPSSRAWSTLRDDGWAKALRGHHHRRGDPAGHPGRHLSRHAGLRLPGGRPARARPSTASWKRPTRARVVERLQRDAYFPIQVAPQDQRAASSASRWPGLGGRRVAGRDLARLHAAARHAARGGPAAGPRAGIQEELAPTARLRAIIGRRAAQRARRHLAGRRAGQAPPAPLLAPLHQHGAGRARRAACSRPRCARLAEFLEEAQAFRDALVSALIYPSCSPSSAAPPSSS